MIADITRAAIRTGTTRIAAAGVIIIIGVIIMDAAR
jgi:hypothetical protein